MTEKMTVQELADKIVAPEYQQPVKTLVEALAELGWEHKEIEGGTSTRCCGQEVEVQNMLGSTYFAQCETCRKFISDVTGPRFSETGGAVSFIDGDKVDLNTDKTWVCGIEKR